MKFATSTLKRAGAGAALAVALLSATGCGYIHHQPTTIHYAASDGVNADVADIDLRNIMVIAENEKSDGRVLGSIINNGKNDVTVDFNFESGAKSVTVKPGETVRLEDDAHKLIVSPSGANPGLTLENTKVTAGSDNTTMNIPVLDGTLEEYAPYLPNAASAESSAASTSAPNGNESAPVETTPAQ